MHVYSEGSDLEGLKVDFRRGVFWPCAEYVDFSWDAFPDFSLCERNSIGKRFTNVCESIVDSYIMDSPDIFFKFRHFQHIFFTHIEQSDDKLVFIEWEDSILKHLQCIFSSGWIGWRTFRGTILNEANISLIILPLPNPFNMVVTLDHSNLEFKRIVDHSHVSLPYTFVVIIC